MDDAPEWTGRAKAARDAGDREEALRCYIEAMAASRREGDMPGLMHYTRHAADLHRQLGNIDEAYVLIRVALGYYREQPPSGLELANTLRIAALVDELYEGDRETVALWQEARDLYAEAGVEDGVLEAERRLAKLAVD